MMNFHERYQRFKQVLGAVANAPEIRTREELVRAETKRAWDTNAANDANADEKRAAFIIQELREFERRVVFGDMPSEAVPSPQTLDMGGQFLTNRTRVQKHSILFNDMAKKVPKGAILHLHFNTVLGPELLLKQARLMDNMFVWSKRALLEEADLQATEMMFKVLPCNTKSNSVFSKDFKTESDSWKKPECNAKVWMRWNEFRTIFQKTFPGQCRINMNENGQLDPAENWILQKMVLSEDEVYAPGQTLNGIWARFNQATRCFKGLLSYKKVYEWYIDQAISWMIDEKVMYAELRPMLLDKSISTDDGERTIDNAGQMKLILDCVAKKQAELGKAGLGHLFPFGLKIIYCTPRSISKQLLQRELHDCVELKKQFPHLICGFDLVGAEDRPNHIGYYFEELVSFRRECKAQRLDIPFLFHAGETLVDTGGSAEPKNSNLFDAVALRSKRIGHGFSLLKHPHLMEEFRKTADKPGICIELCPISNELLHLCRNIKEHPYPVLLAAGIPCTVSPDNPNLFSNSMSHEFYQIMVGAPTISVHSWKQLALWSIEYSCLDEKEKKQAKEYFMRAWNKFCKYVVSEFDSLFSWENEDGAQVCKIIESEARRRYGLCDVESEDHSIPTIRR